MHTTRRMHTYRAAKGGERGSMASILALPEACTGHPTVTSFGHARDPRPPKQMIIFAWLRSSMGVGVWAKWAQETPCTCLRPFRRVLRPFSASVLNKAQKTPQRVFRHAAGRICALETCARITTCISRRLRRWLSGAGNVAKHFLLRRVVSTASTVESELYSIY
jgi:hypothetical protein